MANRRRIRPDISDTTIEATAFGSMTSPAANGVSPVMDCSHIEL